MTEFLCVDIACPAVGAASGRFLSLWGLFFFFLNWYTTPNDAPGDTVADSLPKWSRNDPRCRQTADLETKGSGVLQKCASRVTGSAGEPWLAAAKYLPDPPQRLAGHTCYRKKGEKKMEEKHKQDLSSIMEGSAMQYQMTRGCQGDRSQIVTKFNV